MNLEMQVERRFGRQWMEIARESERLMMGTAQCLSVLAVTG